MALGAPGNPTLVRPARIRCWPTRVLLALPQDAGQQPLRPAKKFLGLTRNFTGPGIDAEPAKGRDPTAETGPRPDRALIQRPSPHSPDATTFCNPEVRFQQTYDPIRHDGLVVSKYNSLEIIVRMVHMR